MKGWGRERDERGSETEKKRGKEERRKGEGVLV